MHSLAARQGSDSPVSGSPPEGSSNNDTEIGTQLDQASGPSTPGNTNSEMSEGTPHIIVSMPCRDGAKLRRATGPVQPAPGNQPRAISPVQAALRKKTGASGKLELWIKRQVVKLVATHYIIRQIDRISLAWVTVVLLGGFATQLGHCDFWFLTALLFLQGVRYAADFTVIVICNKSAPEIQRTILGKQEDVGTEVEPSADSNWKLESFSPEVSGILSAAATSCYFFRSVSYTLRLMLGSFALANSALALHGRQPFCLKVTPASYVDCKDGSSCWTHYPLFGAVMTYYSLMVLIALSYLAIIEGWGWWWTLVSLRKQLITLSENDGSRLLSTYREGDAPPVATKTFPKVSPLTYSHECALRYAYYLYFKCDDMSMSWMLINKRCWYQGPTRNLMVLPWSWIEAIHWWYALPEAPQQRSFKATKEMLETKAKKVHYLLIVVAEPAFALLCLAVGVAPKVLGVPRRDNQDDVILSPVRTA